MQISSVLLTGLLALSTIYLLTRIRKAEKDLVYINQATTQQLSVDDVRRIVNRLTQSARKRKLTLDVDKVSTEEAHGDTHAAVHGQKAEDNDHSQE